MAYKLTIDEINEYKAAFTLFDKDLSGKIKPQELSLLMRSLGQNLSDNEFDRIAKEADRDENGNIEFHEFLELMAKYRKDDRSEESLVKAFKYFDKENTGFIDFEVFKHVMINVAEKLTLDEIIELENVSEITNGKLRYLSLIQLLLNK